MTAYQIIARKYRPQCFSEVLGQDAIVQTLKNAIRHNRLAQAYLFCGSRGTGKTTLARVMAKALNCENPGAEAEPCTKCISCREIASGNSLNVLEIDGASHRGIDDIRQINERVGYATSKGKYKIYIIDEVHMLTKEAFNALLKTLEEPPEDVKFFFATTEPHKVLPTILSRCQRFNLNRIPTETIVEKLGTILDDMAIKYDESSLRLISDRADGGLRDAESLLDQILAFHDGDLDENAVSSVLGVMPRDTYFALDRAGKEEKLSIAFEIAHQIFSQGKDLGHFIEGLADHFRKILITMLGGDKNILSHDEKEKYQEAAKLYRQEQCLFLLDYLVDMQDKIRYMSSGRIALETILLRILRSHQRVPVDILVKRLADLEKKISQQKPPQDPQPPQPQISLTQTQTRSQINEDPTPTAHEIPLKKTAKAPEKKQLPALQPKPIKQEKRTPSGPPPKVSMKQQSQYDTMMNFAAVELEGTLQKK